MSGKIFISYRRLEDSGNAGRLFDRLKQAFTPTRVFMDVDSISAGDDFGLIIEEEVARCEVLLVVIGKNWVDLRDEDDVRKLDNPNDFVRLEIEAGLKHGKRITPVLTHEAKFPKPSELPETLRPLARRHYVQLRHERYEDDVVKLIGDLRIGFERIEAARKEAELIEAARKEQATREEQAARKEQEAREAAARREEAARTAAEQLRSTPPATPPQPPVPAGQAYGFAGPDFNEAFRETTRQAADEVSSAKPQFLHVDPKPPPVTNKPAKSVTSSRPAATSGASGAGKPKKSWRGILLVGVLAAVGLFIWRPWQAPPPVAPKQTTPQPAPSPSPAKAPAAAPKPAAAVTPGSGCPPTAQGSHFQLELKAGFSPDPHRRRVTPGGGTNIVNCRANMRGWVSMLPDVALRYSGSEKLTLTIEVRSDVDTVLLINDPKGAWHFDDDSAGDRNPRLRFSKPAQGRYDIWVGTYDAGKSGKSTELLITER